MTPAEQREAARQFINRWQTPALGNEKQDTHPFWLELLAGVLGVPNPTNYIQFEKPVQMPEADGKIHTRYIDGYIPSVRVLIEQKGKGHALDHTGAQSGGSQLTPTSKQNATTITSRTRKRLVGL